MNDTEALLAERAQKWGKPEECWARVAQVWSGILGHEVTAYQAALCMSGMKLVRAETCPEDPDSLVDSDGYNEISRIVAGVWAEPDFTYPTKLAGEWVCPNPACACTNEGCGCHLNPDMCAGSA